MSSKAAAAHELIDGIMDIQLKLKKAEFILTEITDEFFRKYSPVSEEKRLYVLYEFEQKGIYADIVSDYLFAIRKDLLALDALMKEGRKGKR